MSDLLAIDHYVQESSIWTSLQLLRNRLSCRVSLSGANLPQCGHTTWRALPVFDANAALCPLAQGIQVDVALLLIQEGEVTRRVQKMLNKPLWSTGPASALSRKAPPFLWSAGLLLVGWLEPKCCYGKSI